MRRVHRIGKKPHSYRPYNEAVQRRFLLQICSLGSSLQPDGFFLCSYFRERIAQVLSMDLTIAPKSQIVFLGRNRTDERLMTKDGCQ